MMRYGQRAAVPATEVTEAMVGKWGNEGNVALVLSRENDRIILATPENKTWRMDISDARIDGALVRYIQKNVLHDGSEHPFNGVLCHTQIQLIDAQTLEMSATTVHSPELRSERLKRIE